MVTLSELSEQHLNLKMELLACIEAAQTIELCAGHQKTIIEDILTVSKLDSARLTITPVQTRPSLVIQNTMKMFEKEADRNHATMSLKVLLPLLPRRGYCLDTRSTPSLLLSFSSSLDLQFSSLFVGYAV